MAQLKAKYIIFAIDKIKRENTTHNFKKYRLKTVCFSPVFPLTSAILVPLANGLVVAQYPDEPPEPIRDPGDHWSRDDAPTDCRGDKYVGFINAEFQRNLTRKCKNV